MNRVPRSAGRQARAHTTPTAPTAWAPPNVRRPDPVVISRIPGDGAHRVGTA